MTDLPDRNAVLAALEAVKDPKSGQGLVSAGLVQGLVVAPGRAGFMIEAASGEAELYAEVREAAERALAAVPGVTRAQVVLTAEKSPFQTAPSTPRPPGPTTVRMSRNPQLSTEAQAQLSPPRAPPPSQKPAHVRQVIAVASGKGGVGKSTVAANLACAFARLGYATGLLDADVYGPSVPRLLGLDAEPMMGPDKKLVPLEAHGVKAISIGNIVPEGAPMIWRGPMASSAVNQLLNDVAWGSAEMPLDLLIIDMPPGTGDIQLTIAQKVAVDGAVIVSTPQEVALIDVRRGAAMFEKTATPILGVIENMAYFPDPATGAPIEIFGRGGAKATAEALGAPFLGELPLDIGLRTGSDAGRPPVATDPTGDMAQRFLAMAEAIAARLEALASDRPPPKIIVE
jgi:ATP-binding protein involved in chromosome partitioning